MSTNEGGTIPEENLANYATDRVETTSQVWLGLTVGCARCHDHKFDPISAKDFYSMAAFFRNTTQPAMDGNVMDSPPVLRIPRARGRRALRRAAWRDRRRHEAYEFHLEAAEPAFVSWQQTQGLERPADDRGRTARTSASSPTQPSPPPCATWSLRIGLSPSPEEGRRS